MEYVPGATVPAVALLAPNGLKATLQPGRARGNLWMLPPPTARNFCPPLLSQDKLTGTPTTCASPPMAPLLIPPHTNGPRWLHTHVERASAKDTATIAWGPRAAAEWRFLQGAWDTKHPAITLPVLAKHSTTLEAPAYPVEHGCSQVQDWLTIEWTTFHPQKAYLLQHVYGYLTQGHKGNNDYARINRATTKIIRQGVGVYATPRLQPATTTPWATTEQGARVHAYQQATPCRLPCPDDRHTVIFADASGTTSLIPAAGGAALELRTDATGQLHQHHLTPSWGPALTGN